MNIFMLSIDHEECALMHCNKHVVKMIIEYAQLLSTCHRYLDGEEYQEVTALGRKIKRWRHPNKHLEEHLYKASHIKHPSNIWVRQSRENYIWLYKLWKKLCKEYTYRYGKIHLTWTKLNPYLRYIPKNIPRISMTKMLQAMPSEYKNNDPVLGYRTYYIKDKQKIAEWTKRDVPEWYTIS